MYKYRQQLGGVILLQAPRPTTPDAYDDAWFYNLPCGTKQPGRPAQPTRHGPLLLDEATPFQVPHPDGQGRYYMVDRDDFGRMRREAGGGLQRAAVRLEVGDMCASPLVPVATIAAPRSLNPVLSADFFKSDSIHEVPPFDGDRARVVLGCFMGYDEAEPQVAMWS